MAISAGTKLGPYEIIAPLGAGGMGEVYRARDTRLDRTVAIKILPEASANTPESRARFEREARAVSSLNHAHICILYDIGHQNGTDFIVMEYLEGESLASRLARGAMPVPELLRIGIQIADALDKSHRQGVVHRDLKPGNIMLTKSGAKLLDFGLAKATAPLVNDFSSSPTVTRPLATSPSAQPALTTQGAIVGTFQYMSPEQLHGAEADARSDIFSFGAVLYEMATGKKAFEAKSQASLIAAILEHEPEPITVAKPTAPAALDRVIRTCLAKNPDDRFQSAHDVKLQLAWIRDAGSESSGASATSAVGIAGMPPMPQSLAASRRLWMLATFAALIALVAVSALYFSLRRAPAPRPLATVRFSLLPPEKAIFDLPVIVSPDGKLLAFVAISGGQEMLWVRPLDSLDVHALGGTDGATLPFWAPDSSAIGFFADGQLKKVTLSTGVVQNVTVARDPRGGAWGPDGTILFTPDFRSGLFKIPSTGGTAAPATQIDKSGDNETSHRWPCFLPDGRHFLYFARTNGKQTQAADIGSLDSKEPVARHFLEVDSQVLYAEPGYLVFVRGRTLFAQPFDASSLTLHGEAVPIADGVEPLGEIGPTSYAPFSVSQTGALVYRSEVLNLTQLTWFDRHGKALGTLGPPGRYDEPALSPDGKRLVIDVNASSSSSGDIWVVDIATASFSRFTFDPASDITPIWSPDGKNVVFSSNRTGEYNLYIKPSDGSSNEKLLQGSPSNSAQIPSDWSRDGKSLIFDFASASNDYDLWLQPMANGTISTDQKAHGLVEYPGAQVRANVSPDGRWIAYESNETGRSETWVQSFPPGGGKWQITSEGGIEPQWHKDGRELFYLAPNRKLMAVETQLNPTFHAGPPQPLFDAPISMKGIGDSRSRFAVSPDGQRVLVVTDLAERSSSSGSPIQVVLNWPAALEKK